MDIRSILNSKLFRISSICAFFLIAGAVMRPAFGQEKASGDKEKKFEPKEVILEHIGDSHSWPVTIPFVAEKFLPLPIILYTDKGIETFSSGKLNEGKVYAGA